MLSKIDAMLLMSDCRDSYDPKQKKEKFYIQDRSL